MARMDGDDREPLVTSRGGDTGMRGRGRWGGRTLTGLIAFAALGGFAMVVVYSYDKGREVGASAVAPVIQAQEGPTKVRPETPGGMVVPNRDKQVYSRIDPSQRPPEVERLLPPPEPVLEPPPPPPEEKSAANAEPVPGGPAAPAADDAGARDAPSTPPPAERPAARAEAPPEPAPQPAPEPAPQKQAAVAPAKPAAAARSGAYRVQLLSLRSEDAAKRAWSTLSTRHKDLLGRLEPEIVRAKISGKGTFYRLQAGPLANESAAKTLCDKAKSRKLGCLIVRP